LGGQQRHSLGDGLPGFAVGVFGQRANFVEFQELQGVLDTDRHRADLSRELGFAGLHRGDEFIEHG
jgi:hypothetical protein